jgi:hypothetical protein
MNFWSLSEDINSYKLYILEGNSISLVDDSEDKNTIDAFLKSRSSLQKAQFMIIEKSIKFGNKSDNSRFGKGSCKSIQSKRN